MYIKNIIFSYFRYFDIFENMTLSNPATAYEVAVLFFIIFFIFHLAYRCLQGTAPTYLAGSLLRHLTSTTRRRLCSADSHACGTVHQTFNARRPCLPTVFGTCVEQPAVVCHECIVADDVPSRTDDYFFGRRLTMTRRS